MSERWREEMEGENGGEEGGREGEGVSEEGRKEGGRGCLIFSGTCMSENLAAINVCIKPSRMCTCVLYNDSCCPILLKVLTLWGSFEIKKV